MVSDFHCRRGMGFIVWDLLGVCRTVRDMLHACMMAEEIY